MARFIRKNKDNSVAFDLNNDFYVKAVKQAMMSGGSIVVFLPEEKKIVME